MKRYTIITPTETKHVTSNSGLEALIDESTALKKQGIQSFYLEVYKKDGKRLASLIR